MTDPSFQSTSSNDDRPDTEFTRMMDQLLEADLSEAELVRLEAMMLDSPQLRAAYLNRAELSVLLEEESRRVPGTPAGSDGASGLHEFTGSGGSRVSAGRRFRSTSVRIRRFLAAAAAVSVILAAFILLNSRTDDGTRESVQTAGDASERQESEAAGFAVLAALSDAEWEAGSALQEGALLPPGTHRLQSGLAELELFSGVTLFVEGPAELQLVSPMEAVLNEGRITAQVPPPAHGFRVRTRGGEVVDLGTEFSVSVTDDQASVEVHDGEIEWHRPAEDVLTLTGGRQLQQSFSDRQSPRVTDISAAAIPATEELRRRMQAGRDRRFEEWTAHQQQFSNDPRLVLHYRMHPGFSDGRRIPDQAASHGDPAGSSPTDGHIVASERTGDRWGRPDGAVSFSPVGSRIRCRTDEPLSALTMICWVRIDSLDRWYNSLFLTDGHDLNEPHWQLMNDGRMFFSVKKREAGSPGMRDKYNVYSPSVWDASQSGCWQMLAVVYEPAQSIVRQYRNGSEVSRERIPDEYVTDRIDIGRASLGNWSEPVYRDDAVFTVRNLNGCMDEFAILDAALTSAEIEQLFQAGAPW